MLSCLYTLILMFTIENNSQISWDHGWLKHDRFWRKKSAFFDRLYSTLYTLPKYYYQDREKVTGITEQDIILAVVNTEIWGFLRIFLRIFRSLTLFEAFRYTFKYLNVKSSWIFRACATILFTIIFLCLIKHDAFNYLQIQCGPKPFLNWYFMLQ